MTRNKNTINVLAIDGGGIKGVIPAQILIKVEKKLQEITNSDIRLGEHFDLIVGTSTGSILTAVYTIPGLNNKPKYSSEYALELYQKHGSSIFKKETWRKIKTVFGLFGSKYNDTNLITHLTEAFGDVMLGEASTNIMITAIDIKNRDIFLFKSYNERKKYLSLVDAVRSSSAAPTYFEPYKIEFEGKEICLIDGGMAVNNPSISAYIEAKKLFPKAKNINLLSIGTGKYEKQFEHKKVRKWGGLKWLLPLIDIMLGSTSEAVEYQVDLLYQTDCTGSFLRINPALVNGSSTMDDTSKENIENLIKDADDIADKMAKEIEEFLKSSLDI